MRQHRSKSRPIQGVSTNSDQHNSNDDIAKRESRSTNTLGGSMVSTFTSSSSETLSACNVGVQITGGQPSSLLRGTKWRSPDSSKVLNVEPAELRSVTTDVTTSNVMERKQTNLSAEFQEDCTSLTVSKLEVKSKESNSVQGLSDQHLSTSESMSLPRNSEGSIIGVDPAARLDGHLAAASEKLTFYYNNNIDKEHHECQDKFKALIDALNETFMKLHGLLQVSNLPILDEVVAHRFHDAQQELIVLEDLVSQVKNMAERHGYSCGIKESLEDMALTLYCLRQMHNRQNVLVEEIVMTRRENIELLKMIEAFRNTRPVQRVIDQEQAGIPGDCSVTTEPSRVVQEATTLESPKAAAAEGDNDTALPEGHSESEITDPLVGNLNSANVWNIEKSSVFSSDEMSGNTSNQRACSTSSWTVHIDCSLFVAVIMAAVIAVILLTSVDDHRFVNYCCGYRFQLRSRLFQTCYSWQCTYRLAFTFPWN